MAVQKSLALDEPLFMSRASSSRRGRVYWPPLTYNQVNREIQDGRTDASCTALGDRNLAVGRLRSIQHRKPAECRDLRPRRNLRWRHRWNNRICRIWRLNRLSTGRIRWPHAHWREPGRGNASLGWQRE